VGSHTITLTATDSKGSKGTATVAISVIAPNQPPTASISAPATGSSFAQGASVGFSGSGTDPEDGALTGGSLVWTSSRDGQIGAGATFSTTALSAGSHTITLTATDSKGATGTATVSITITTGAQLPQANFTAVCSSSGLGVHQCLFDGSASTGNGLVKFSWDWGNGRAESHTTPTSKNTFATAGTYNVTLTVTDGVGQTSSVTKAVVVP
jgi:PKD repeat protein